MICRIILRQVLRFSLLLCVLQSAGQAGAESLAGQTAAKSPFFRYLTESPPGRLVAYSPLELDPRYEANHRRLSTNSIMADLKTLRPVFDGVVLYGYHDQSTPRIVEAARDLRFRAVVLGIWDPRLEAELNGVAALVDKYGKVLVLAVVVGNEGLTFRRYTESDLTLAAERLRRKISREIPITTSEPLAAYERSFLREFGDFLAPNIHPVFDRPGLPPAEAANWVRQQAVRLVSEARKPVFVKETGLPHGGKAGLTPQVQRDFWESYLRPGVVTSIDEKAGLWAFFGVAFEAFDLSWKAEASGLPIESHWGLFSSKREPYPAVDVWRKLAADR